MRKKNTMRIIDFANHLTMSETKFLLPAIISSVVSIIVSTITVLFVKRFETRDKLSAEYSHEQRKKIRELTGKYHGRILRSCVSLNHRIWNLFKNEQNGWLDANGRYRTNAGYYLISFAHRFLYLVCLIRQFEKEAIFLDSRYTKKDDFIFMHYLEIINWAMTDVSLFKGIEYDSTLQYDHFFSDRLRSYAEMCLKNEEFINIEEFEKIIREDSSFDQILKFFDGLKSGENRLRWDRLLVVHLFLVTFINKFGYKPQKTTSSQISTIVFKIENIQIIENLRFWMNRFGISKEKEIKLLDKELKKRCARGKEDLACNFLQQPHAG